MVGASSWEGWNASWERAGGWADDHQEGEKEQMTPHDAGYELFQMLVELKLRGYLSARQSCLIAHWATLAGAEGDVRKLAFAPNRQSGKYSAHFDAVTRGDESPEDFYSLRLSKRSRVDANRWVTELPVRPPHEALQEELFKDDRPLEELNSALRADELPEAYKTHPVVLSAPPGSAVHPLCLYLDGVAYTRTDSILGIWCHLLFSDRRHLLAVIRKSEMCACGCRGWDSLHPIMRMLHWSLEALAAGKRPQSRHDGSPFGDQDLARASVAGEALGFRAAAIFLKGDWSEFCSSLGFPSTADGNAPCPICDANSASLYDMSRLSPLGLGHAEASAQSYDEACNRCEFRCTIRARDVARVRAALHYDRRQRGAKGRALLVDFPHLGLRETDSSRPTRLPTRPTSTKPTQIRLPCGGGGARRHEPGGEIRCFRRPPV